MDIRRRDFLKLTGLAAATGILGPGGNGRVLGAETGPKDDGYGLLIDTTRCVGCRSCELACAEANGLKEPERFGDEAIFQRVRTTSPDAFTVVNRYETQKGQVFRKQQCMHCLQPACESACLVRALQKHPEGPVTWNDKKCLGCRYCMISCPFDVPKFEYNSPNPRIRKCTLCFERVKAGKQTACAEACPVEAIRFGKRLELLETAKTRIYQNQDSYIHSIYGEHEAGGTSVMYLSAVPFEQLGLNTGLDKKPYPELTQEYLHNIVLVDLFFPIFLLGMSYAVKGREKEIKAQTREEER